MIGISVFRRYLEEEDYNQLVRIVEDEEKLAREIEGQTGMYDRFFDTTLPFTAFPLSSIAKPETIRRKLVRNENLELTFGVLLLGYKICLFGNKPKLETVPVECVKYKVEMKKKRFTKKYKLNIKEEELRCNTTSKPYTRLYVIDAFVKRDILTKRMEILSNTINI